MRILWISSLAWNQNGEYEFPVNGPGAVSGSLFQQQLILGLRESGIDVDIVAEYPYANRTESEAWTKDYNGSQYTAIPSSKSQIKNRITKTKWIKKITKKQLLEKQYDIAIAYLIHTPFMSGLKIAKSLRISTILICPDLPDMMDMSLKSKPLKRNLKKIDMMIQRNLYRNVDGFVLFTQFMREKIPIKNKPFVVIEGIASLEDLNTSSAIKEKAVMHAGTLHKNIGIEQLLEAMNLVKDKDIRLWIFGDGELKEKIINASLENPRIIYKGFVGRKELFEYEKKASALINVRNAEDEYTKYSFPSKTFEYLYSGTPFISTKLLGVPSEYDKYMYYIKDNSPQTIANAIDDICLRPNLNNICEIRQFLADEKCRKKQASVLISLIKKLL